ncbi:MAG: glycosyltransferase [Thermodesulfobacteriota bacterium]|nr:glycosyltransferase [Thermodesulfobacteriota bacterium]
MKTTMVIPSYWSREGAHGTRETDAVYDHPTPLNEQGTLGRALESLSVLRDRDFDVVIIAVPTAEDIEEGVEEKVSRIVSSVSCPVQVHLFTSSHLRRVHEVMRSIGGEGFAELLSLRGYSCVRNLCLFLPHILGSEIALLIDDDEVFEDPGFMSRAREFIGRTLDVGFVGAVAGYYLQPDGHWRLKGEMMPWMEPWDKLERMNEAFEQVIGTGPRLKETPFVFGGNMVMHRDIFTRIPFDPGVTRGEDIDYLINMRMFGYKFFLDNTLAIKHLPPPKAHTVWKRLREDVLRFVFERTKLRDQEPVKNMARVTAEELDPYPGAFLKDDLEAKIERACLMLADHYRAEGKEIDAAETLKNIAIAKNAALPGENSFQRFIRIKKLWEKMMDFSNIDSVKGKVRGLLAS